MRDAAFFAEIEQMAGHHVDDLVLLVAQNVEIDFGLGELDAELSGVMSPVNDVGRM